MSTSNIAHLQFTFRPCTESDLPIVSRLSNYWIDNSIADLATVHRPLSHWTAHLSHLRSKSLPFILAVTTSLPPDTDYTFRASSPPETLLGYTFAAPFRNGRAGYERAVEPSVYISPATRTSGVGTALSLFLALVLKFPTRWPEYGTADLVGEKKITRYCGCTTMDAEGVGRGKVEWFTKVLERDTGMRHVPVGIVEKVGRKWKRDVDLMWITFDLEGWRPRGEEWVEGEEDLRKLGWAGQESTTRRIEVGIKPRL